MVVATEATFAAARTRPTTADTAAATVFAALHDGRLGADHPPRRGARLPVCDHLGVAVDAARAHDGPVAELADAIARIGDEVAWGQRSDADDHPAAFAEGHADAVLVHSGGPEPEALVGLSLLAPGVTYPDHQHPPEEVYVVLSPGEFRRHGEQWHAPGIGGVVYNPPTVLHAMRSGDAPLLAVWLHARPEVPG